MVVSGPLVHAPDDHQLSDPNGGLMWGATIQWVYIIDRPHILHGGVCLMGKTLHGVLQHCSCLQGIHVTGDIDGNGLREAPHVWGSHGFRSTFCVPKKAPAIMFVFEHLIIVGNSTPD